jgi:xylulokinase
MTGNSDLFLGLDLSTQQLKGIIVTEDLECVYQTNVEFDGDLPQYSTVKGVYNNPDEKEVQAPVVMWLDALDLLFAKIVASGEVDLNRLRGISGACQQHGSVFWNEKASTSLTMLSCSNTLKEQLQCCLAWQNSPNWQDHSTGRECEQFEQAVGGKEELARITGSRAHHRFTGPQILKLKHKQPEVYKATDRIVLVSSFLASVVAGRHAGFDISDVCGMNLWDLEKKQWHEPLLRLFGNDLEETKRKLGHVETTTSVGKVSRYFVDKYGVSDKCVVVPFTGDNPGTILSMPLEANDVIVSLGTSTTALVVTEKYVPSSMYHMFTHPAGKGYMGMLCYCNGALAREQIRDKINHKYAIEPKQSWNKFDELVLDGTILGGKDTCIGFYFPLSEIIPDCHNSTLKRLIWRGDVETEILSDTNSEWRPEDDALRILESQALSIRYRLAPMLTTETRCPRRVYYVGGSSRNDAICTAMTRVLMPTEGAFRLDLVDACAKGAANLATFGALSRDSTDLQWERFINDHWHEKKQKAVCEPPTVDDYAKAVPLFIKSETFLPA